MRARLSGDSLAGDPVSLPAKVSDTGVDDRVRVRVKLGGSRGAALEPRQDPLAPRHAATRSHLPRVSRGFVPISGIGLSHHFRAQSPLQKGSMR